MEWLFWSFAGLVLLFGFVVLFGAPYLPVLSKQKTSALELLALKPGDTLLELGSGDGRVMRAAAAKGMNVVGYELNPVLVLVSLLTTWKYRKNVRIIWGDYWSRPWPEAQGIFVFLLPKYMKKLDTKITQYSYKPVKLMSFAFEIPSKRAVLKKDGLFLYLYK